MVKKIIAYILIFATVISFAVVPVFASGSGSVLTDFDSATFWSNYFDEHYILGSYEGLGLNAKSFFWSKFDKAFSSLGLGAVASADELSDIAAKFKTALKRLDGSLTVFDFNVSLGRPVPTATVAYDSSFGVYRLRDDYSGLWLVNSIGHFPYYRPDTADDTTGTGSIRTGQWTDMQKVGTQTVLWHVVSSYELNEFKEQWSDLYSNIKIMEATNYYWLVRSDKRTAYVLCDKYGNPYYLPKDKETAVTTPQNYYQDTTNNYIDDSTTNNYYDYETNEYNQYDNSTNVNVYDGGSALVGSPIDINNGIINVGGEVQYIDNINYDASTQTYYVDAHDEYTYDTTNNYYTTNNHSYFVQYHINYTSITYIGQTAEYDKRYELYYQLPDGRSSADLTAEDLEQLSTVFADVVPYARSADDLSMRALYHFDGNTEDSSYWSYCTAFDWAEGASLTYMDEGTFGGSLYLDENEHDFTVTLPSTSDLASDFTIQFRYYQSYTAAPKQDSYIFLGSDTVFQFTGSQYLNGSGTPIGPTSIGNWNEICIMKSAGTIHYYINGVWYASVADNQAHGNTICFFFGSTQQTYKKLDELRISKSAVYTPGEDYTPTAVPFDTNLSLVLPDGDIPMADEVMVFTKAENNILDDYGLADWTSPDVFNHFFSGKRVSELQYGNTAFATKSLIAFNTDFVSLDQGETGVLVNFGGNTAYFTEIVVDYYCFRLENALFFPVKYRPATSTACTTLFGLTNNQTYTLSVVLSDGTSSSITFVYSNSYAASKPSVVSTRIESPIKFESGYIGSSSYYYNGGFYIYSESESSAEIIYMELVEGSEPGFSVSYEQAMYSSGELKDSPVLAVRTNRPIAGYQIGGVRPSYPSKGLVYAMVENSRIISLQQYTGYAWEEVDGRIWTGERWIPYSSFDVFTLQDFYDIIGGSVDDYEYIYTESGFWAWWQKQWISFTSTLQGWFENLIAAVGGDLSVSIENNTLIDDTDKEPFDGNDYKGIVKVFRRSVGFITDFFSDFIMSGITEFFDMFDNISSDFFGFFALGGLG